MGGLLLSAVMAIIGGIVSAASYGKEYETTQNELEQEKQYQTEQYNQGKENLQHQYEAALESAMKKADRAEENANLKDASMDAESKAASNAFNTGVDSIQNEQEANLFSWNNALASIGANKGNELAAIAGNGTRAGSSLANAVELEAAQNYATLQIQKDQSYKANELSIRNLYQNNLSAQANIHAGRVQADQYRNDATDIRDSWKAGGWDPNAGTNIFGHNIGGFTEGGSNWQLWQDKFNTLDLNYQQNIDRINKQKQKNYDNSGWGVLSAFFNGGGQAFNSTMNLTNLLGDI